MQGLSGAGLRALILRRRVRLDPCRQDKLPHPSPKVLGLRCLPHPLGGPSWVIPVYGSTD